MTSKFREDVKRLEAERHQHSKPKLVVHMTDKARQLRDFKAQQRAIISSMVDLFSAEAKAGHTADQASENASTFMVASLMSMEKSRKKKSLRESRNHLHAQPGTEKHTASNNNDAEQHHQESRTTTVEDNLQRLDASEWMQPIRETVQAAAQKKSVSHDEFLQQLQDQRKAVQQVEKNASVRNAETPTPTKKKRAAAVRLQVMDPQATFRVFKYAESRMVAAQEVHDQDVYREKERMFEERVGAPSDAAFGKQVASLVSAELVAEIVAEIALSLKGL
jgi:hypothetical protein